MMVDTIDISARCQSDARIPRAAVQGGALIALLCVAAASASYALAGVSGGTQPVLAAALTLALCLAGGGVTLWGLGQRRLYPHTHLGLGNVITLTRGAGIFVLAGQIVIDPSGPNWIFAAIALALLLLDGLDGWAARRARLASPLGARVDVETDVAFALTLAALAVASGQVGLWFLALGLLRPGYLLAQRLWPRLNHPLPDAQWRRSMAAVQMGAQVVLISPLLRPEIAVWAGALLLGVMLASFGRDLHWLARRR